VTSLHFLEQVGLARRLSDSNSEPRRMTSEEQRIRTLGDVEALTDLPEWKQNENGSSTMEALDARNTYAKLSAAKAREV
jgi:hypothetical protein